MDGGKWAEVSDRKVVATGMRFVQPVECLDDAVMKKRVWFSIPVFLMLKESIDTDHDGISLDDGIGGFPDSQLQATYGRRGDLCCDHDFRCDFESDF